MQGFSISYSNPDIRSILEESKDQKSSLRNSKCLVRSDEVVPSAAAAQEDRPFVCESSNVWSEPCDGVWNIDLGRASTLTDLLHPHLVKAANLNKLMERLTTPPLKSNVHVEECAWRCAIKPHTLMHASRPSFHESILHDVSIDCNR